MINAVGKSSLEGELYTSGTGYVIIPVDLERSEYIRLCYLQNRISIKTEDGAFFHRVPIDPWVFNFIEFPEDVYTNGTMVVWVSLPLYNHPIIIGRIPKNEELSGLSENQFKFGRHLGGNFVEITGNSKEGSLGLTISNEQTSNFLLNVYNKNKQGNAIINVQGDIEVISKNTNFNQNMNFSIQTTNEDDETKYSSLEQDQEKHVFKNDKFQINNGKEPITLGTQLQTILNNLFTMLGESTVTTSLGQMPLLNGQQIAALKDQTDKILSKISFTD